MSDNSKISWTDATWQPVVGCSHASPGCANCYAERMAVRLDRMGQERYRGLTRDGRWTGDVRLVSEVLEQPLHWRKPRRVFVCSMGDLFHESVPFEFIAAVFGVMAACPQHTFQILTKRAARMRQWFEWASTIHLGHVPENGPTPVFQGWALERMPGTRAIGSRLPWPLPNVWLGVTAEDQPRADERIPHLLATPAAVRFVSVEPMIGPINLTDIELPGYKLSPTVTARCNALTTHDDDHFYNHHTALDWVIVGGGSGPRARPMHPDWARSVRDQCAVAGVPFFFKQWGEWSPDCLCERPKPCRTTPRPAPGKMGCMFRCGAKGAVHELDGREHREMPEASNG